MNRSIRLGIVLVSVCAVTLVSGTFFTASAQNRSSEEIEAEIQRLEQKKQELQAKKAGAVPSGQDRRSEEIEMEIQLDRFEKMLGQCVGRKTDRCAELMYTLGSLYYDQAKEQANRNQAKPDYSKSLNMYWQVAMEYPKFEKLPEAYIQMSTAYLLSGHLDTTRIVLELLVNRFPNSPRASSAHFRLANFALLDKNNNKAEEHFKKVKQKDVDSKTWETTQNFLAQIADPKLAAQERIKEAEPVRQSYGASIAIGTLPANAEIYIGGKLVGKSNEGKLQVPVGTYQVKFVKDGIEKTETMTFKPGENPTMFVPLK